MTFSDDSKRIGSKPALGSTTFFALATVNDRMVDASSVLRLKRTEKSRWPGRIPHAIAPPPASTQLSMTMRPSLKFHTALGAVPVTSSQLRNSQVVLVDPPRPATCAPI